MSDEAWRREVDRKLVSHDKDIHSIALSVKSIDESVKKMADLQISQAVRDQSYLSQIKEAKEIATRAHARMDESDKDKKKIVWLLITPMIVALTGTVAYKANMNDEISEKLDTVVKEMRLPK